MFQKIIYLDKAQQQRREFGFDRPYRPHNIFGQPKLYGIYVDFLYTVLYMHRKALSLFQHDCHSQSSHLHHSNHLQFPQSHFPRTNKKLVSAKLNSYKSSLEDLKPSNKNNVNTIFSSRLFDKAHRIQPSNKETFLPVNSQIMLSNQQKIRNVYEVYLKLNGKDKSISTNTNKKKGLSLSERDHNSEDKANQDLNRNQPFISSLTKIVMDQCHIPIPQNESQVQSSDWVDILCKINDAEIGKKSFQKGKINLGENPYQLLPIRKKPGRKQNRGLVVQRIQKKRQRS